MRRQMRWAAGLAAVVAGMGCQPSQPAELSQQDIAAIQAIAGKWTTAQMAADWTAMGGLLADNIALFPPNLAPVEGRDAAMKFLQGFPKLSAFTASSVDVSGRGDLAYDRGTYTFTTEAAPNAPSMSETGTYVAILRRQADGSWKVTRDIWHSDSPAPPPAAAAKK